MNPRNTLRFSASKTLFFVCVALIVLILPQIAQAVSPVEFFPESFEQTIILHSGDPMVIAARIINAALLFLGVMVVVLILYGGFLWMTAAGNEEKIAKAKKILTQTVIGLVIILSAFIVTRYIFSKVLESLGAGEVGEQSGSDVLPSSLPFGSFVVKGITPQGSVKIRNVTVKVILNKSPNANTVNNNVVVTKKIDGSPVAGSLSASGAMIKFIPEATCPAPNQNKKCFDAETDYKVEVKSGLQSTDGKSIVCGGLAPSCSAEFHTGSLVDVAPPKASIEYPDNGSSVSVDSCVKVQAKVQDDSGVAVVEFFVDDQLIPDGTVTPPAGANPTEAILEIPCWDTTGLPTPSNHLLKAKAYDIDENDATSLAVKVTVRPSHCFDGALNNQEDDVDCDKELNGPSGCGLCDGSSCTENSQCAGGNCDAVTKTCISLPKILGLTPGDGKPGTFVTVAGLYFGATPGKIYFTDNKEAGAPAACDASKSWTAKQVVVGVPSGAQDGPVKLCTAAGLCDATNDNNGPIVPELPIKGSFDVNDATHPGLCLAYSPTPNTACVPGPAGDVFCQDDNKSASGQPDKSAFCHKEKQVCVFPKGKWNTPIYLEGAQFGPKGYVSFSGVSSTEQPISAQQWSDKLVETVVPPLKYGPAKVQVVTVQSPGVYSNAVDYTVLSPDTATLPEIINIDPLPSAPGQGITISGKNFGNQPGLVWFVSKVSGLAASGATTGVPPACNNLFWQTNEIKIKVPEKFPDGSEVKTGEYDVYVHRYDNMDSQKKLFKIDETLSSKPFIWCMDPSQGPAFVNLTIYGEKFGQAAGVGGGLFFTSSNGDIDTVATLTNVGGTAKGTCPSNGWSQNKICAQVPGGAVSGLTQIKTKDSGGLDVVSNKVYFKIGSCVATSKIKVGGKDVANPSYAECLSDWQCCGDGSCHPAGTCPVLQEKEGAYGWEFSTKPTEIVPHVIEECLTDAVDTAEQNGKYPSPAPWSGREGGDIVCLNSQIAARFDAVIDAATLSTNNIVVEKCSGGVETDNLWPLGDFENDTAGWAPKDAARLKITQVTAPQDDLLDDSQIADNTFKALRLEKLQAEPDRSLGESADGKKDGNQYTDSFAAILQPLLDAYGKSYKLSVKVKAAQTQEGDMIGKINAIGQKAGVLIRKVKTDGSLEGEKKMEISLTENWQNLNLDLKTEAVAGTLEVRLFLASPPASEKATDFHKYAAFFDDLKISSLDTVVCQSPQTISGKILLAPQDNPTGFTYMPGVQGGDKWDSNSWYRVTLKTGIKAKTVGDLTGAQMKEDAAKCGQGNAYCWLFKTGSATCKVKEVWTIPNPYTATKESETIDYNAVPVAEDVCVPLNPTSLNWQWSSSDNNKAQTSFETGIVGRSCNLDSDCPIGPAPDQAGVQGQACVENSCVYMPWTTTAVTKMETGKNNYVGIIATAKDPADTKISKDGTAKLYINFLDPKIVEYWPNCGSACLNASIGASFNIEMDASTLNTSTVKLFELACGNGKIDPGEDCDDGNTAVGDGCDEKCLHEGAQFAKQCGDGSIDYGEECDDGKVQDGDGCSAKCLNEGTGAGICGNQKIDAHEDCDDGNDKDGDGCSAKCLNEGTGVSITVCGNGKIEKGEECEKGAGGSFDAWCDQNTCLRKGTDGGQCHNGKVDPGEECDDSSPELKNNPAKQVLCNVKCLWTGTAKPVAAGGAGCGNGKVEVGEDCDDGGVKSGDGCSNICTNEGSQQSLVGGLTIPVCGNNQKDYGEDCDDGNTKDGDGCSAKCLNEGTPYAACGNGAKEQGEDCDWKIFEVTYGADFAKILCPPPSCTNVGFLTDTQKDNFKNAGKLFPVCGNNKFEDGEDCDGSQSCGADCKNLGRSSAPVDINSPIPSDNNQTFNFKPSEPLLPLTSYRVVIDGSVKSKETNKPLTGLNYFSPILPELVEGQPNAFSWVFTTKNEKCSVDTVEVMPAEASLYVIGSEQAYMSQPRSAPDECDAKGQKLDNLSYGWGWSSSEINVATISNQDVIASCGDGIVEKGEDCDDGNKAGGDGCSANCLNEGSNYANKCGDGNLDLGEDCDPPDAVGIICTSKCTSGPMRAVPFCDNVKKSECCGDGVVAANEECDDGNPFAGDGCSPFCTKEGSFAPLCGNGFVDKFEECDKDLAGNWLVGCDKTVCLNAGTGSAVCGNKKIEWGEDCDDGNLASGDGCSAVCLNEGTVGGCGNGVKEKGEDCDDGVDPTTKKPVGGDGCSVNCLNEGTASAPSVVLIDPYQTATAVGVKKYCRNPNGTFVKTDNQLVACFVNSECDTTKSQTCVAPTSWSFTDIKAKVSQAPDNEIESKDKEGAGQLTVYCSAKSDTECEKYGTIKTLGRGNDSCCYARPTLAAKSPTGGEACPNALLTATFSTVMDANSLSGNFILARGVTESHCPSGTVPVDIDSGQVLSLVSNGSFEEALIEHNTDGSIKYQTDNPVTTDIDEGTLQVTNPAQAEGWVWTSAAGQLQARSNIDTHIGDYSLKQETLGVGVKAVKKVNLQAGFNYRLSAFYKVISGNTNVSSVRLLVRKGEIYEKYYDASTGSPTNWKVLYLNFTPPQTGEYTIELIVQKPVTVYWDDVSLEVLGGGKAVSSSVIPTRRIGGEESHTLRMVEGVRFLLTSFVEMTKEWLGIASAQAQDPPLIKTWCAGEITLETSAINGDFDNDGDQETKALLKPSKMLEKSADYRLIVRGDSDLKDDIKEGVLSAQGVALDATGAWDTHGWTFKTDDEICTLDNVNIDVTPVGSAYEGKGTDTTLTSSTAKRNLTAEAKHGEQLIQPVTGYGWTWNWNDSDNDDVSAEDLVDPNDWPTGAGPHVMQAKNKNGDVVVTANAKITDSTAVPEEKDKQVSGTKQFSIFICENPWPTSGEAYQDTETTQKGNAPFMNFAFRYCMDAGLPVNIGDDLPALDETGAVLTPVVSKKLNIATPDKAKVLKEFLFPVPPSDKDIIGIRVMENANWLSPMAWYKDQGFIGQPQALQEKIDGYEAIQDGTTVYIAATNESGGKIYSNIYLISYNADASTQTKNIRDQIVKNFKLNVNLPENQRTCSIDNNNFCSADINCNQQTAQTCNAPKDKLLRDVQRIYHLKSVGQALESYKKNNNEYPRLQAGTFIRGMTNSEWPSWSAVLGNALGAALSADPLDSMFGVGFNKCKGDPDYTGFAEATCWNAGKEEYKCPPGSQIYQYKNLGPNEYELGASFEYKKFGSWINFKLIGGGKFNGNHCPDLMVKNETTYSTKGFCGDGKIQNPNEKNVPEKCELGQTKVESCDLGSGKHCWGSGLVCDVDTDCAVGEGPCVMVSGDQAGQIQYQCQSDCSDWTEAGSGECKVTQYCGNGLIEDPEVCDDGLLNGQYGKCKKDCTGTGPYCGDGAQNGPEKCDEGLDGVGADNGMYGQCNITCTGQGAHCGDGIVTDDEQCDGNSQTSKGFCQKSKNPCQSDADCDVASNENCQIKGPNAPYNPINGICGKKDGYEMITSRVCGVGDCQWGDWTPCYKPQTEFCDNGVKEGTEECDDGNKDDTDSCVDCKLPKCNDGKVQSQKVCIAPVEAKWKLCTKDTDCAKTGGKCQATEVCDSGADNGQTCDPIYGISCAYCGFNCQKAFVQGPYCGDKKVNGPEQCDTGGDTSIAVNSAKWKCVGEVDKTDFWWDFEDIPNVLPILSSAQVGKGWANPSGVAGQKLGGADNSASALRVNSSGKKQNFRYAQIQVLSQTPSQKYRLLAKVNTNNTDAAQTIKARLVIKRSNESSVIFADKVLDTNTSEWEKIVAEGAFVAGADETLPGVINLEVWQTLGTTQVEVYFDKVHLELVPYDTTCSSANCWRECPKGGIVCDNTMTKDAKTNGNRCKLKAENYAKYDCDGDDWSNNCDLDDDGDGDPDLTDCAPTNKDKKNQKFIAYHDATESCPTVNNPGTDNNCSGLVGDGKKAMQITVKDGGYSLQDDNFKFYVNNDFWGETGKGKPAEITKAVAVQCDQQFDLKIDYVQTKDDPATPEDDLDTSDNLGAVDYQIKSPPEDQQPLKVTYEAPKAETGTTYWCPTKDHSSCVSAQGNLAQFRIISDNNGCLCSKQGQGGEQCTVDPTKNADCTGTVTIPFTVSW